MIKLKDLNLILIVHLIYCICVLFVCNWDEVKKVYKSFRNGFKLEVTQKNSNYVNPDPSFWCFYNQFGFGLTRLTFG